MGGYISFLLAMPRVASLDLEVAGQRGTRRRRLGANTGFISATPIVRCRPARIRLSRTRLGLVLRPFGRIFGGTFLLEFEGHLPVILWLFSRCFGRFSRFSDALLGRRH